MRRRDAVRASGGFFGGTEGDLPRPAPRQAARAGARFSFAGRSAVLRRGRCEPALLRAAPKDAVAVPSLAATPACLATWAGGLLFGGDGVAGPPFPARQGMPPPAPRPPRSPRQSRLRSRTLLGSRRAPRAFRRSHEAAALPRPDITYGRSCHGLAYPSRFAPAACNAATWRIRADGCISPCDPRYLRIVHRVAPGRRQPQATAAAPVPDFHRPSVVQSVGRLLPTTWPQGHK